jgi:hypothetical protein
MAVEHLKTWQDLTEMCCMYIIHTRFEDSVQKNLSYLILNFYRDCMLKQ